MARASAKPAWTASLESARHAKRPSAWTTACSCVQCHYRLHEVANVSLPGTYCWIAVLLSDNLDRCHPSVSLSIYASALLYMCLCVCVRICMCLHVSLTLRESCCLSVGLPTSMSQCIDGCVHDIVYLSLLACLFVCPSVWLCVYCVHRTKQSATSGGSTTMK